MLTEAIRPAKGGRRFAIGDIHGRLDKLQQLLESIEFNKRDCLYFLGDYIDRGPNSKEVLDTVIDLQKHYIVQPMMGNHELMFLYAYYDKNYHTMWSQKYGAETLQSFGVSHVHDIDPKYVLWIKSLPCCLRSKNYILSHAGVDFSLPNPFIDTGENRTNSLFRGETYPDPSGKYKMIIGHQTQDIHTILESAETNLVYLDGGCGKKKYGKLCAFNFENKQIIFV